MNKYIIKNCPACNFIAVGNQYRCKLLEKTDCQDCTDCLLKRIVKLCEYHIDFCENCNGETSIDCIDCTDGGKNLMAQRVLELLEIEECE